MANVSTPIPSGKNPNGELTLVQTMKGFFTEEAARDYFEQPRSPNGAECPHCGNVAPERIYKVALNPEKKIRAGLYKCAECVQGFTVPVGMGMENTHLPLNKWLVAFYIMCASKTQISAIQVQRQLAIGSYRAWFLCHRIRYALEDADPPILLVGTVEPDETYIGSKAKGKDWGYVKNKTAVVSLVKRGGKVRSQVVDSVTSKEITKIPKANVDASANLNIDRSPVYTSAGKHFASHDVVNHSIEEYSFNDEHMGRKAITNTAKGFFGNAKRSIDVTHHHINRNHTTLYFAEIDHKYNPRRMSNGTPTVDGIKKMEGKRLMLRRPKQAETA